MDPPTFSRREVILGGSVAGAAVLAACGRTEPSWSDTEEHMATPVQLGTPISLTASGTIKNGSVGGVNADALYSPYGLPMEIYEIKWMLSAPTNQVLGAGMGCSLELGDLKLTNGYVPINAYCKMILSTLRGGDFVDYSMGYTDGEEVQTTPSWANFVWRLRRPIFVPAGSVILPKFQHRNLIPDDISVQVIYSGTTLPSSYRPKRLVLPWVAYWAGAGVAYSDASVQTSLESDLVNPWDEPLLVHRFVGRMNYSGNITSVPPSERFATAYDGTGNGLAEQAGNHFTLQMVHSSGANIIQSPTKFESVFYSGTRAWDVNVEIAPKSYFVISLNKTADAVASGNTAALRFQPIVGMVGSREIGAH